MLAANDGAFGIARLLLEYGADVAAQDHVSILNIGGRTLKLSRMT